VEKTDSLPVFSHKKHTRKLVCFFWEKTLQLVVFPYKTILKHICNVFVRSKLKDLRLFQNWKNPLNFWLPAMCQMTVNWHPAFAQQSASQNGSRITYTGPMALLKICRVIFRVQRSDWIVPRGFLKTFRRLFRGVQKISHQPWNMWKFLFNAMEGLQPGQKCFCDAQNGLKLFGGVFSSQNKPKTYLQRVCTTKIESCR